MKRFDPARLSFVAASLILAFLAGMAVRHYRIFPYSAIRTGVDSVRQVFAERETLTGERPQELTQPARHVGKGVTHNEPGRALSGLTFISSFFDDGNEMRLIRLDGSIVNRWPVRYFSIFPNPAHLDKDKVPQTEWNLATHGALLLPDGSMVFSFEGLGMAKLDRCGQVLWTVPKMTHHSVEPSRSGGFWTGNVVHVNENSPFPLLKPPYYHESVIEVSADGEVLREISVLGLLFKNHMESVLFSNGLPGLELPHPDPTHLNDVEELSEEMAAAFPQFSAGDLLLSLRSINMVLVVDPVTEKIKWSRIGPWLRQHDADFQPTGRISIFNNNNDGTTTGDILGGSQILEVDPSTGETTIRYGSAPGQNWYSFRRGKHQYLPNGNILITDSESGRVVEVDGAGEIVWEFINRYDDQYVAVVRAATRYPEDYFSVSDWTCAERTSAE